MSAQDRLVTAARSLRWLLGAVLVAFTIRLIAIDPTPFLELAHVKAQWLGAMVGLMVLNQWLTSRRFELVMRHCTGVELSGARWFQLTSIGQFLNLFVPQLGHVYRGIALRRDVGLDYPAYTTGLFIFFWFELLVGIALAAIVVAACDPGLHLGGIGVLPVLLLALGAMLVLPPVVSITLAKMRLESVRLLRVLESARTSLTRAQDALRCRLVVAQFIGLNLVVVAVQVSTLWFAFDAVGGPSDVGSLMLFQVLIKLSGIILITPGNVGITELAYGALAGASSSGVQHGIAAALLMRTLGTVVLLGLGAASGGFSVLMRERRHFTNLRDGDR